MLRDALDLIEMRSHYHRDRPGVFDCLLGMHTENKEPFYIWGPALPENLSPQERFDIMLGLRSDHHQFFSHGLEDSSYVRVRKHMLVQFMRAIVEGDYYNSRDRDFAMDLKKFLQEFILGCEWKTDDMRLGHGPDDYFIVSDGTQEAGKLRDICHSCHRLVGLRRPLFYPLV